MSRSEPKPKIIYKNLDDLIRSNSNSKGNGKSNSQRIHTQGLADITNKKESSTLPLRKTKFIQVARTETSDEAPAPLATVDLYSTCYNQIDAIFTEMEDFFCHSKEKVLEQVRAMLQAKTTNGKSSGQVQEKVEEIKKMSEYIKHISKYFIYGEVPQLAQENCYTFTKSGTTTTVATESYEDESTKMLSLSMKNSKIRANRRGELIHNRKKTVYELILEEKESKAKLAASGSKKAL